MYLGIPRLARDQDPSDAASGAGRVKKLKIYGSVVKFGLPAKPQLRMRYG